MKDLQPAVELTDRTLVTEAAAQPYGEVLDTPGEAYEDLDWKAASRELITARHWRVRLLVTADAVVAASSVYLAFWLSPAFSFAHPPNRHADPSSIGVLLVIAFLMWALALGLYEDKTLRKPFPVMLRSCMAGLAAWCVVAIANAMLTYLPVGRWIIAGSLSMVCLGSAAFRVIVLQLMKRTPRNIMVIGMPSAVRVIEQESSLNCNAPTNIVAVVEPYRIGPGQTDCSSAFLREIIRTKKIDAIVVSDECNSVALDQLVQCMEDGLPIDSLSYFLEENSQRVPVEMIDPRWVITSRIRASQPLAAVVKRAGDLILATVGLVLTLPLWPVIAILIKTTSPGPVFYRQSRVGRYNRVFSIRKFRTMCTDAECDGKAQWARANDRRVTTIGRVLRRSRLDEVPQFLNVLLGDMSFVGPRPERPEFVAMLETRIPHYRLRHLVKPGITGWAQINYRYGAGERDSLEKLRYDLYYVKHGSLQMDAIIVIRTIGALMRGSR